MKVSHQTFRTVVALLLSLAVVSACKIPTVDENFSYQVRVQKDGTGEIIKNAKVIIEVEGSAPLIGYTDSNGYAQIFIDATYAKQPGRLRVEATGYEPYWKGMNISEGSLPEMIYMVPLGGVDATTTLPPIAPPLTSGTTPIGTALPPIDKPTDTLTFTPVTDTPTSTPSLTPTWTPPPPSGLAARITDAKGVEMALIPAGEFLMGSTDADRDAEDDEKPPHKVYLDNFYIDIYEATNALYTVCVHAGGCTSPQSRKSYTRTSYYGDAAYDNYPVIYVDWNQAYAYCAWRGARLPTEAEWEKAARGTDGRIYPWGNEFNGSLVNFCDKNCSTDYANQDWEDGHADTSPVGSYPDGVSPYGVFDMAGNVWEWVQDWYQATYYNNSPYSNPIGPGKGSARVLRGGSWVNAGMSVRSAERYGFNPGTRHDFIGIRCAYTL